jgi:PAS domain S-box-containing protein
MDTRYGMEALFQYATEGILITSDLGDIMRVNPAANKMFGYEQDQLIGEKIEVLLPRNLAEKHVQNREHFNQHPSPRSMGGGRDLFGRRKDETEFPVEVSLSPFTSLDGRKYVIGFIVDITVRKKQELELRKNHQEIQILNSNLERKVEERTLVLEEALSELGKSRQELRQALKKEIELNELKSRFVSMASHEFRTPLTTILSSISLIGKYGEQGDKEKQAKHIDRVKSSITHLTDILNDILSISKLEEGKTHVAAEKFNLKAYVVDTVIDLQGLTKENQEIRYVHTGKEDVYSDKKILRHLIFNLVSNAIKFSPEGKDISISTITEGDFFILEIKDKGIGISEEDKKHLFERFFRGYNATHIQGTGLGLNIVAKYIELLNGSIDFKSQLEVGTSFYIKLPMHFTESGPKSE